jgi:RNA polymerase sigma-70 factor (sigma-E family)
MATRHGGCVADGRHRTGIASTVRHCVRRRDDGSFVEFVTASGTALLRTARLLTNSRDDAEDLLQTALEKAYRNWSKVSAELNPEPYVRRILVNTVISRGRRRRILREVQMSAPPEVPITSEAHTVELRDALIEELRRLGPRQRAVLVLRYWEDLPEAEVADLLGCSVGTVKSQAARGLAQIRRRMDGVAAAAPARGRTIVGRQMGAT